MDDEGPSLHVGEHAAGIDGLDQLEFWFDVPKYVELLLDISLEVG